MRFKIAILAVIIPAVLIPAGISAQPGKMRSAAISDMKYTVTFGALQGVEHGVNVAMTFNASGKDPVLLSLPVWTPGDYEVSNYARNVSKFEIGRAHV